MHHSNECASFYQGIVQAYFSPYPIILNYFHQKLLLPRPPEYFTTHYNTPIPIIPPRINNIYKVSYVPPDLGSVPEVSLSHPEFFFFFAFLPPVFEGLAKLISFLSPEDPSCLLFQAPT
jgi:hypothetical protein